MKRAHFILLAASYCIAVGLGWLVGHRPATQPSLSDQMQALVTKSEVQIDQRLYNDEAHTIGYLYATSHPSDSLQKLLIDCSNPDKFAGGCLHGVVMAYGEKTAIPDLSSQCLKLTQIDAIYIRDCIHGVGHTLANQDVTKAIHGCEQLNLGDLVDDCVSGVFMEQMLGTHNMIEQATITTPKTLDCTKVDQNYVAVCTAANGSYLLYYPESNASEVAKLCDSYNPAQATSCIAAAIDRLKEADPSETKTFCDALTTNNCPSS